LENYGDLIGPYCGAKNQQLFHASSIFNQKLKLKQHHLTKAINSETPSNKLNMTGTGPCTLQFNVTKLKRSYRDMVQSLMRGSDLAEFVLD
jgi:hypothetical protein